MTMLANDITAWLASAASLVVGTNIFVGSMDQAAEPASSVAATGGPGQGDSPSGQATFQVISRAATPAAAMTRAMLLYRAIHPLADGGRRRLNVSLSSSWRAFAIEAIQFPADLGEGEDGKFRTSFNVLARVGGLGS